MIYKNILDYEKLEELRLIVKKEIKTNHINGPDFPNHPKWQSYNFMHNKYKTSIPVYNLVNSIKYFFIKQYNMMCNIESMWFVLTNQDSFEWYHSHKNFYSGIFYLENTNGNGTVMLGGRKVPAEDNSLFFLEPHTFHKAPSWDGRDRYTIGMNLETV